MDNKFEEAWKLFKQVHPDELFARVERTVAEVFWEAAMQEPREIEATNKEFDLWLGLKKRVHELEREVAALRALNIASLTDAAKILELTKELAASREMGPCGKHPNVCYGVRPGNPPDVFKECLVCAELATTRADALEQAMAVILQTSHATRCASLKDQSNIDVNACDCGNSYQVEAIRALITPADAAARDERDRRIRLEEQERCLKPLWSLGCEIKKIGISLDQRETADEFLTIIESLRAPAPAERVEEKP